MNHISKAKYTTFIGIDIAKSTFVVANSNDKQFISYSNTLAGYKQFYNRFKNCLANALIVLETTGGYEISLIEYLLAHSCCVHRAHALKVKNFIRSLGKHAKTDNIDAQSLVRYAQERYQELALYVACDETLAQLKALMLRRRNLAGMRAQEKNRLKNPNNQYIKGSIEETIEFLDKQIADLDNKITDLEANSKATKDKLEVMQSVKGVGKIISRSLLYFIPEIGNIDRRQLASLVGLAPHPKDSGLYRGYRKLEHGRDHIKQLLFVGALSASKGSGHLGDYYRSLIARGKKPMVALAALMRKMIVILNARMRDYYLAQA